jgi:CheY-like chemotaxis protein
MNKQRKALVIEDSIRSQKTFSFIFRVLKWEAPAIVSNGKEALHLLKENTDSYDVIILDYGLPAGMNGLEFMSKAKALVKNLPPVIMVTGEYDTAVKSKAKDLGIRAFFLKSDLDQLKTLLKQIFDQA